METKIYIKELPCYQKKGNASEKKLRVMERHFYNLGLLATEGQQKEMEAFIRSRGKELSLATLDADIIHYKVVARFMKEKYPLLNSFRAVSEEVLVKKFKAWLINQGYQITRRHYMKSMGRNLQEEAGMVKYLRLLLHFLEPEDKRPEWEKDIWNLENLGFEVRQNPIQMVKTISFTGIGQETIREEVKRASYIRIKYLSVGSLQGEIRAVRHFSEFLKERYPEIKSLGSVERLHIEEYLTHINLERGQERNLKTEMANLKDMLRQVGKVLAKPKLGKLFIKRDMPKAPEVTFKTYSDEEIRRLNEYIVNMEEQTARALILHQMLGGRISDTLTLRTDCLYQENGHYIVRMYQVKTSYYEKPVPEDVAKLIQKSMEYTYERYGETEYIFVNESNPSLPFQYSMLKHRMYALIHENDICKDNGERMGFATHLFRHCYGMKLVEMHLDDAAIAHLLGHRGVGTVYRYRRASGKLMVKETEELRKIMDEILSEIIRSGMGMSKYSKMVETNQKTSKEKIDYAIQTIKEMLEKEEQLLVCDLVRKTGLSRAFFYKNPTVSKFLNEARQQQEGKVFHQKKKVILDYALERQNELIKMEYEKSQRENKDLKAENEKLKKALKKKEVAFIKGL